MPALSNGMFHEFHFAECLMVQDLKLINLEANQRSLATPPYHSYAVLLTTGFIYSTGT